MDPTWTAPLWQIVMTAVLGFGSGTVAFIWWKISLRPKLPRDLERSRHDLELGVRGVVNACVELSERVRELVVLVKRLPPEYRPAAEHALRLAQVIEEATYDEGAKHGIFPRPMFTAGDPPPRPRVQQIEDAKPADPGAKVLHLPRAAGREWIGGQLLPASSPVEGEPRTGTG